MIKVFISHNSKDKHFAREIGLFLAAENINIWYDEWQIPYGGSIPEHINDGLDTCTHFLLLWSENAKCSSWVRTELDAVVHKASSSNNTFPVIIPILLDDTPLPPIIASRLSIKYSNGTEEDRYRIIKAVSGNAPSSNYIEAIVKKYHEVIFDEESQDILPFKACPNCGKEHLKHTCANIRDDVWFIVECNFCGWIECTE